MNDWQRMARRTQAGETLLEASGLTQPQTSEYPAAGPVSNTDWEISALRVTAPDVEKVIEVFTQAVNRRMVCASFVYQNDEQGIFYSIGAPASHSLTYRLAIGENALGEMLITREQKFSGNEISWIESQFSSLAYALRNSLLYRESVTRADVQWPRSITGKFS